MKRYKHPANKCKRVFPLFFWKECCNCNIEFKLEKGYKLYSNDYDTDICVCGSCCNNNKTAAYNLITKHINKVKKEFQERFNKPPEGGSGVSK
jgi:hypothetical protein